MRFNKNSLQIDAAVETNRLVTWLRQSVRGQLRRRGAVVGISGGVDSAVVLALCVRAFGPKQVTAIMMPDKDSSAESERLARKLAAEFEVEPLLENMTASLEGFGCYQRRDEAIQRVFAEYNPAAGYRAKIVLPPDLLEGDTFNVFSVTIVRPDGTEASKPLPTQEFLQIVAASNFKQRSRMAMLYYHAELRHFAVIGTANRNERQQGFFVKHGDSGVDCDPIAHLYKTQIYQLAAYLGVPEEIQRRTPTSDTYSAPCSQEEFFFRLPFATMDLLWFALENNFAADEVAEVVGLTPEQVQRAFDDFARKQKTTEPLRQPPLTVEPENKPTELEVLSA
jgi:NAD+ synthase